MSKPTPGFTWEDIDALRGEHGFLEKAESPPRGSFTNADYCERYGMPLSTAKCQLGTLVRVGKLQTARYCVLGGDGRRRMVVHYWRNA